MAIEERTIGDFRRDFIDLINAALPDVPFIWEPVNEYGLSDDDKYVTVTITRVTPESMVRRTLPGDDDQVIQYYDAEARLTIFGIDDLTVHDMAFAMERWVHCADYKIMRHHYDITINRMGGCGIYHRPSDTHNDIRMISYGVMTLNCSFAVSYSDNVGYIDTVSFKSILDTGGDQLTDEFDISQKQ